MSTLMPPPADHPAQHIPPAWFALSGGPGHDAVAAWRLNVPLSITACSFRAGLPPGHVRADGGPQAAHVDPASGQLGGIVHNTSDVAFQLHTTDTRIWRTSSTGDGESGTR